MNACKCLPKVIVRGRVGMLLLEQRWDREKLMQPIRSGSNSDRYCHGTG